MRSDRPAILLLPLALAGCAESRAGFPTLAPRPIEALAARADPAPPPAETGSVDPALAAAIAAAERAAADADRAFAAALGPARALVARAGEAGGESWAQAEQSLSALQALREAGAAMLPDLDARASALETSTAPGRAAGLAAIAASETRIDAIDQAHGRAIDALTARLPAG